ncbi:MAG: hypothetical protein E8D45_07160 [Nitrospira sp.]|nr:MAG: hypothetical protein E8D45_07160 [Nitrospira sp.]
MKMRSILGALLIAGLPAMPALAENMTPEDIKKLVDEAVNKKMQEHERREGATERREAAPPTGPQYPVPTGPITEIAKERPGEEKVPLGFSSTGSGKLVYAKPFLSAPKATVGGYTDAMFTSLTTPNLDNRSRQSFNNFRMVPFIYADITDRVKFATELEFERGGPNAPITADGGINLEFAQIDYLVNETVNLRAGIILMPVGKFNLLHDSPLNDLVDRPMVSRMVIPSTWFDSGAGIYGTLYPTRLSKLDYELYVVNGLSTAGGPINDSNGLRNAKGSISRDRDDSKSIVGRVAVSPMLGLEVAGSFHHGLFKKKETAPVTGANGYIDLFALDWTLQKGPFEFIGESAWARISNNAVNNISSTGDIIGPGPAGMQGYYLQGNYHFMPEWLKKVAPSHFSDASTFTAVIRWESVDTDTDDRTLALTSGNRGELQRLTLGLNFRPIEDTVFKFDWQFNTQKRAKGLTPAADFNGSGFAGQQIDGNGFLFMAATYF